MEKIRFNTVLGAALILFFTLSLSNLALAQRPTGPEEQVSPPTVSPPPSERERVGPAPPPPREMKHPGPPERGMQGPGRQPPPGGQDLERRVRDLELRMRALEQKVGQLTGERGRPSPPERGKRERPGPPQTERRPAPPQR